MNCAEDSTQLNTVIMKSEVSTQPIAKNRMVKCTLFFFFAMATAMLVFSHHAVTSSALAGDRSEKLSVPVPKRQPAKGGLPPIPDFVMKQLEEKSDTGNNAVAAGKPDISDFPLPSDAVPVGSAPSEIMLKPTFGSHRPDRNAVFAFAEGYDLQVYTTFIESLKQTSFTGDVVLAVSYVGGMKPGVEEYLRSYSQQDSLRVISYALEWECYKKSGVRILPENGEGRGSTTNHGFSDCKIHGLYSDGEGGETLEPAQDPREARPVATARYELYWIFSRQYRKDSSMLIIDVRDTYFQSNPFEFQSIPHLEGAYLPMNQGKGCRLELFEENFEAVDIGKSSYNSKWVRTAYGQKALNKISSKPVICSGSTMGTQYAVELYSAAMVAQFDETKCK